jgi:WD40 repeat protein
MDVREGVSCIVTGQNELVMYENGAKKGSVAITNPTCVAISPSFEIAVGKEDGTVQLFDRGLNSVGTLSGNRGQVTCLQYSPDGTMIAVGDTNRSVLVYDTKTHQVTIDSWVFHNARVNCISWSADSKHCVTGSLDTSVEIWSVENPMSHIPIKNAHLESVTGVAFLDDRQVVSVGADACIRVHSF